jgi:broad-specificity NMP kinase
MLYFIEKEEGIRKKNPESKKNTGRQLAFFAPSIFIICGPSCAGKTTLANYVLSKYSYYHIEASDFMYLNYYERHGAKSAVDITSFASDVLKEDPGIVVNRILNHIKKLERVPIMITGFRSPDEIDLFVKNYSGELKINSVYIMANQKIRYNRSFIRNREDATGSFEEFSSKDNVQNEMGLNSIKKLLKEATIINENSISKYFKYFETVYGESLEMSEDWIDTSIYRKSTKKLEQAILKALQAKKNEDNYFTTTEISHLINELDEYKITPKAKDNVSRYFNQNFHPYYEIFFDKELDKLSYRLSNTGLSRAKWLFRMK